MPDCKMERQLTGKITFSGIGLQKALTERPRSHEGHCRPSSDGPTEVDGRGGRRAQHFSLSVARRALVCVTTTVTVAHILDTAHRHARRASVELLTRLSLQKLLTVVCAAPSVYPRARSELPFRHTARGLLWCPVCVPVACAYTD